MGIGNLVIHRNLRPANVKVTDGGTVNVLDFGLAKVWAADLAGPLVAADRSVLTSRWSTPNGLSPVPAGPRD